MTSSTAVRRRCSALPDRSASTSGLSAATSNDSSNWAEALGQRPRAEARGGAGVGPEPQLGLRPVAGYRPALDAGDRVPGAPCVRADLAVQQLHIYAPRSMSGSR